MPRNEKIRKDKREEQRKGRDRATEEKPPNPSGAIDALIGDEEQNEKHKNGSPTQTPWAIR